MLYSFLLSLFVSYQLSSILFKQVEKIEKILNASLPLLKINYSLVQSTLFDRDPVIYFIELIKESELPISLSYRKIFEDIHNGQAPEPAMINLITPSKDFNTYVNELVLSNFRANNFSKDTSIEREIRIYTKEIEPKLSLVFFIGFFFPIGLCFSIIFLQLDLISIFLSFFFILFMRYLFKNFITLDLHLIGFVKFVSDKDKRRFNEFLTFLNVFALHLKYFSPEKAFSESMIKNREKMKILFPILLNPFNRFLYTGTSFDELLNDLKLQFVQAQYRLIFDLISHTTKYDSEKASNVILELIEIVKANQEKAELIEDLFTGERFKVFMFIFLLPIIIGIISGFSPFFSAFLDFQNFTSTIQINYLTISIILISLSICTIMTSYTFLQLVNYEHHKFLLFSPVILFIISFFASFSMLFPAFL